MKQTPAIVKLIESGKRTAMRMPGGCPYKPHHAYVVKTGQSEPISCHITIVAVSEQKLGDMTLRDFRKEGFKNYGEFHKHWIDTFHSYDPEQVVSVVFFELGDTRDIDRFPSARSGGPGGDYTSVAALALSGSGSEVSEATQSSYAADSQSRQGNTREEQRKRLEAVVRDIRSMAQSATERKRLKSIEHHIKAMENEARRPA